MAEWATHAAEEFRKRRSAWLEGIGFHSVEEYRAFIDGIRAHGIGVRYGYLASNEVENDSAET